jgi:uncharacterized paraquat-inducible protein A
LNTLDISKKLSLVKIVALTLDLIGAAFVAWNQHYLIALFIFITSILILQTLLKCPHCGFRLDFRLKISEETHCPKCGKMITKR